MKSHRNAPQSLPRRLAAVAGLALLSLAGAASAGETVIRTAHGDVAALDAPKPGSAAAAKAAQAAPFATARQRAAVKPLIWETRGEAASPAALKALDAPTGPAASAPGGGAPAFNNYLARQHFPQVMNQLRDTLIFPLHAHLVDNHPGRQVTDLLQHRQSIFPQSGTGLHNIHNHFRQPHNGRQLNGAVQFNDFHRLMLLIIEIVPGNSRIFRRHPNHLVVLQ